MEDAAAALTTPESRRFAYEMAVAVASPTGSRTEAERAFLDHLRELLGVDAAPAAELERQTQALLTTPSRLRRPRRSPTRPPSTPGS